MSDNVTPILPTLRFADLIMGACKHLIVTQVNPRIKVNVWDGFLENLVKAKIEECGVPNEVTGRGLGEFLGIIGKTPKRKRISRC